MNAVVRFFTHPIWCLSPLQIAAAVKRDLDGDTRMTGKAILGTMLRHRCTECDIEYTAPDGRRVVIECRLKPDNRGQPFRDEPCCEGSKAYLEDASAEFGHPFTARRIQTQNTQAQGRTPLGEDVP